MSIRLATRDDVRAAAEVLASAYVDDEQDAYMFPNRQKYWERYLKTKESIIKHGFEDPTATVMVAVEEEKVAGVCIWYRDGGGEEPDEGKEEKGDGWLARLRSLVVDSQPMQYLTDLFDPLVSASNVATMARTCASPSSKVYFGGKPPGNEPCMGIMDIAVHREFQQRGIAKRLVKWGMAKARGEGLPIELSATPEGEGLYRRLGFRDVGVWRWRPGMEGGDGMGGWKVMRWEPEAAVSH